MGEAVYLHEIVLDPARADLQTWAGVVHDVREYFGEAEAEKLARLADAGETVHIDMRAGKVSRL